MAPFTGRDTPRAPSATTGVRLTDTDKDRGPKAPVLLLLLVVLAVAALFVAFRPTAEEGPPPGATEPAAVDPAGAGPRQVTFAPPGGPGEPTSIPLPASGGGEVVVGGPGGPEGPHGLGVGPGGTLVGGPDPVDPETPEHRATGVRGRVTTSGGAPVAGARVQLRGQRPGPQGMTMMIMQSGPDGELEAAGPNMTRSREATTDADGRYEVTGLDAAYRYDVRAAAPAGGDLLPGKGPAPRLQAGAIVEAADVALRRAGRLEGTTRGPDGRPLAGVRVTLGGGNGMFTFDGGPGEGEMTGGIAVRRTVAVSAGSGGPDGPEGDGPRPGPFGGKSTKSDDAGRFAFERVAAGRHTLEAMAKGLRAAKVEVELAEGEARRDLELRLAEGLALSVRVTDDQGAALAGATVRAQAGFGPMPGRGASATTDAQGLARLDGLSSSELTLQVQADGFASHVADVVLGAGDPATARVVVLEPGASVTGRLVDGAGQPVTKGFVMLEPLVSGPDVDVSAGPDQRPGPDGRFRIRGVRKGSWRLRAHSPGVAPGSATVEVTGRGEADVGDVVLAALLGVDVVVQDPDGAPVEGAVVEAGQGGGGMMVAIMAVDSSSKGDGEGPMFTSQRQGKTGVDGRVHLEGLEPGGYTVRASCAPFADGWGEARVVAGQDPDPVIVKLTLGGKVDGRVLPAAGEPSPPPATGVSLFRRGREMPVATVKSGADGAFVFERVAPGEYRVSLGVGMGLPVGPGLAPKVEWFRVEDGATVSRTLERPPAGSVEGVVRDATGAALAGVEVGLGFLNSWHPGDPTVEASRTARTDSSGRYRFEGVSPSRWGLSVRTGERSLAFAVEVAAGATRRDLTLPAEQPGSPVTVPVTDEGGGKAGARVLLERTDDGPLVRREATTGEDGVARFEGVPSGAYAVSASAPGRARARASLVITGPAEAAPLALAPGVALLLAVRADGPVPGPVEARVIVRPVVNGAPATDPNELRFTSVEVGGQVRIDGLTPGAACEVTVDAPGFAQAKATFAPASADPTAPEVVTLRPE